jgi:hypothetical protein
LSIGEEIREIENKKGKMNLRRLTTYLKDLGEAIKRTWLRRCQRDNITKQTSIVFFFNPSGPIDKLSSFATGPKRSVVLNINYL